MHVIYRLCGIASSNPSPIYQEDKYKLNELCLKSFIKAFSDVRPEITFLLDNCGPEYQELLNLVPFNFKAEYSELGINGTMLRSYKIASELEDYILLAECDHLWLPDTGKTMLEAIKQLGLVSGYDHPDFYSRFDIHNRETELVIVNNHHFRKSTRTVMSWGCHSDLIKANLDILNYHGYLDGPVWSDLRERGHQLYTPITSLSTHMVKDCLAPGINWSEIWLSTQ